MAQFEWHSSKGTVRMHSLNGTVRMAQFEWHNSNDARKLNISAYEATSEGNGRKRQRLEALNEGQQINQSKHVPKIYQPTN
eukprot:7315830-Lingulodinium_polyedra.AAC.1